MVCGAAVRRSWACPVPGICSTTTMQRAKSLDIRFVQAQMDAHAAPWWLVPNQTRARAHMREQRQRPAFASGRHWVLAVGASPLRITFAAMAERVFGLSFSREVTACHHLTSFITEHASRSAVLVLFLAWWMSQHQTARTA